MKEETWNKLEEIFEDAPMMRSGAVSDIEIEGLQEAVSFDLPQEYKKFISKYGGATVGAFSIFGIGASETMGDDEASALEVTERYMSDGWEGLEGSLVVSADHSDNPIFLNNEKGVWISDHDFGGVSKVAESFEDYIVNHCMV